LLNLIARQSAITDCNKLKAQLAERPHPLLLAPIAGSLSQCSSQLVRMEVCHQKQLVGHMCHVPMPFHSSSCLHNTQHTKPQQNLAYTTSISSHMFAVPSFSAFVMGKSGVCADI